MSLDQLDTDLGAGEALLNLLLAAQVALNLLLAIVEGVLDSPEEVHPKVEVGYLVGLTYQGFEQLDCVL